MSPVAFVIIAALVLALACERREVGRRLDNPGPVVARVNGKPLYKRDFDGYLPTGVQRALTSEERREYLDRFIATQLLYEAAQKAGIEVTPDIESRMEQLKKDLVADQLVQRVIKQRAIVTDSEVRAYYDSRIDEYTNEYRVSHILVSSLEDAEEVKELLKRQTFSWVARRHSLDKHTGIGGDLGFLSKGNMIPEFEAVVFDMKVGDVSDVIESDFGYHIIKLTAVRRSNNALDYEDAAESISRQLLLEKRAAVYDSLITSLMDRADIDVIDPELRNAIAETDEAAAQTGVAVRRQDSAVAQQEPVPPPVRSTERQQQTAPAKKPEAKPATTTATDTAPPKTKPAVPPQTKPAADTTAADTAAVKKPTTPPPGGAGSDTSSSNQPDEPEGGAEAPDSLESP